MGVAYNPSVVTDGLVLYLDGGNSKSFRGQVTRNRVLNSSNMSGTAYAESGEWTDPATVLTKTFDPNVETPIGYGATKITESGVNGFHHLSRYGGGGTGNHSLSCYVKPLSNDITNFSIGMLLGSFTNFNLVNRTITYPTGEGMTNGFIVPVPSYPDWFRVGVNFYGRNGGWVGFIGYNGNSTPNQGNSSYTGVSGGKPCYITGVQYEYNPYPTSFVEAGTTRGASLGSGGGLLDISGNSFHGELVNGVAENQYNDSIKSLIFDGTDDYVNTNATATQLGIVSVSTPFSISLWFKTNDNGENYLFDNYGGNLAANISLRTDGGKIETYFVGSVSGASLFQYGSGYADNNWHNVVLTWSGSTQTETIYVDGALLGTNSRTLSGNFETTAPFWIGNRPYGGGAYGGNISNFMLYLRQLSSLEVQQNFAALRGRFGI